MELAGDNCFQALVFLFFPFQLTTSSSEFPGRDLTSFTAPSSFTHHHGYIVSVSPFPSGSLGFLAGGGVMHPLRHHISFFCTLWIVAISTDHGRPPSCSLGQDTPRTKTFMHNHQLGSPVGCSLVLTAVSLPCRPWLGQPQPGSPHLHRMLRYPPQPRHAPVPRALPGPGRLAHRAHQGHVSHWQRAGQQCVGGEQPRPREAFPRLHQVGPCSPRLTRRAPPPPLRSSALWESHGL